MFEKNKPTDKSKEYDLHQLEMTPEMMKQLELETSLFLNEIENPQIKEKDPSVFNFTTVMALVSAIMGGLVLATSLFGAKMYVGITLLFTLITGISFLTQVLRVPKQPKKEKYKILNDGKKVVYNEKTGTYSVVTEQTKYRGKPIKLGTSKHDKKIFGLAGGLANYFGVDSGLVRALMVIAIFITNGIAIPAYIILSALLGTEKYDDNK